MQKTATLLYVLRTHQQKTAAVTPEMVGAGVGALGGGLTGYMTGKGSMRKRLLRALLGAAVGGLAGSATGAVTRGVRGSLRARSRLRDIDYRRNLAISDTDQAERRARDQVFGSDPRMVNAPLIEREQLSADRVGGPTDRLGLISAMANDEREWANRIADAQQTGQRDVASRRWRDVLPRTLTAGMWSPNEHHDDGRQNRPVDQIIEDFRGPDGLTGVDYRDRDVQREITRLPIGRPQ